MGCSLCKDPGVRGYCYTCSIYTPYEQPAPKEKEMEPIERIANAAEAYIAKATDLEPLHTNFIMAQLNHIDRQYDPPTQEAILRAVWERAYFAALTGLASDKDVRESWTEAAIIANATVAAWPAMTAERDTIIKEKISEY